LTSAVPDFSKHSIGKLDHDASIVGDAKKIDALFESPAHSPALALASSGIDP
jgi:hypothetical protein